MDRPTLERIFLDPYQEGSDIVINGKVVQMVNIEQIKIAYSDSPSSMTIDEMESVAGFVIRDWAGKARRVAESARDVTSEFINGPPGTRVGTAMDGQQPELESYRRIFFVHGRWNDATDAMADFLRSLSLEVVDWEDAVIAAESGSRYPAEILDAGFRMCHVIVVFMTPDDLAAIHPSLNIPSSKRTRLQGQPRPNVIFEAGMAWQRDRGRTLIIEFGILRSLSDLAGVDRVRFDGSADTRRAIVARLRSMKARVNDGGGHWLRAGRFPPPLPEVVASQLDCTTD